MPKKTFTQNSRYSQTLPMSAPHPYTVKPPVNLSPLAEDDDDDICPVCESECTCHSRPNQSSNSRSPVPTPTSTSTSTTYSHLARSAPPMPSTLPSLKIKLTVPPNIKFRRDPAPAAQTSRPAPLSHHTLAPTVPKRRGRPPKAVVAAREAAKAALAASHSATTDRGHPPLRSPFALASTSTAILKTKNQPLSRKALSKLKDKKKPPARNAPVPTVSSLSSLSESENDVQFPTFMSAASSSSLTSSSESSEIDSDDLSSADSDMEDEERFILQSERDKARVKKELLGDESGQRRRTEVPSNRWEIKPRKKSVGASDSDSEGDTEESSEEEEEADDEDDGEADEDDEAMEADVEETGFIEADAYTEREEDDGKLGVSFDGVPSGWSDDEEESSFDAELFFANLDDSSDSDGSPAYRRGNFANENNQFSADEQDALLLMDVDSSARVRRTPGEFEVGVDLDGLSIGLDSSLLPSPFGPFDTDISFDGSTESDVDMTIGGDSSSDDSDELALVETDGETTEDELVDSDGLPNSRAMMMFRWPTSVSTVSTVDPQSTLSPGGAYSTTTATSVNASQTTRIALASMSTQRGSPAPTPAEILAGKISMDDLDEIEIFDEGSAGTLRSSSSSSRRTGRAPVMGQFVATPVAEDSERRAIVDGSGSITPSPFPRSRVLRAKHRKASSLHQSVTHASHSTDAEPTVFGTSSPPLSSIAINTTSSDELVSQAFQQRSGDLPTTNVIDLDDVLDASMLDSGDDAGSDDLGQDSWHTPKTPVTGTHMRSLTRWDRIPVATFRRTRETPVLDATPASDNGISGRFASIGALSNDMLGTPEPRAKAKASLKKRSQGKFDDDMLVISPVLLPVRDGDTTPTNAGPSAYHPLQQDPLHQQKSRRDQRREKAMLKKKMTGKYTMNSPSHSMQRHHRPHHPNMKSRGNSSMQRSQFTSSNTSHVPHLNI